MLQNMRRKGPRLYFFRPVEDLHHLNPTTNQKRAISALSVSRGRNSSTQGMFDMTGAGPQLNTGITVEMEEFAINVSFKNTKGQVNLINCCLYSLELV